MIPQLKSTASDGVRLYSYYADEYYNTIVHATVLATVLAEAHTLQYSFPDEVDDSSEDDYYELQLALAHRRFVRTYEVRPS